MLQLLGARLDASYAALAGSGLVFSGSTTVPEDTTVGSSLGTFSVQGGSGPYTYAITSGNGAGKFGITTNTLTLAGALDYETTTSYALTITADNGVTPVLTLYLTINVGDVAEFALKADFSDFNTNEAWAFL